MRGNVDDDSKLKLDAAKASMSWIGKDGKKVGTTIFGNKVQVNQTLEDPKKTEHILASLKDISLITNGHKIQEET